MRLYDIQKGIVQLWMEPTPGSVILYQTLFFLMALGAWYCSVFAWAYAVTTYEITEAMISGVVMVSIELWPCFWLIFTLGLLIVSEITQRIIWFAEDYRRDNL